MGKKKGGQAYDEKLYGSATERRYEHIAWMIQGIDPCGAACFDGERLLISTNEKSRLTSGDSYATFDKPIVDMVKSYLKFVVDIREKMEADPAHYATYQGQLQEEMDETIGKMDELIREAKQVNENLDDDELMPDFRTSIKKVTGSLLPWSPAPFPKALIDAIKNGRIEFIEQAKPDRYGHMVHAELRIVNELIKSGKLGKGEQKYRIGVSKRCCLICEHLITAVNEVMGEKSRIKPIVEEIGVRGTGHGVFYPAAIPDFLGENSGLLKQDRQKIEYKFKEKMFNDLRTPAKLKDKLSSRNTQLITVFNSKFEGTARNTTLGHEPRSPSLPGTFDHIEAWSKKQLKKSIEISVSPTTGGNEAKQSEEKSKQHKKRTPDSHGQERQSKRAKIDPKEEETVIGGNTAQSRKEIKKSAKEKRNQISKIRAKIRQRRRSFSGSMYDRYRSKQIRYINKIVAGITQEEKAIIRDINKRVKEKKRNANNLKRHEKSTTMTQENLVSYNLGKKIKEAAGSNQEIVGKFQQKSRGMAAKEMQGVIAQPALTKPAGNVRIIPETDHGTQHGNNAEQLIAMIKAGELDSNTVICLERKQEGKNLGMADVIMLAGIMKHNVATPEQKINIPSWLKDSQIYKDAELYNAAKEKGMTVVGIEGKKLKYSEEFIKTEQQKANAELEKLQKKKEEISKLAATPELQSRVEKLDKQLQEQGEKAEKIDELANKIPGIIGKDVDKESVLYNAARERHMTQVLEQITGTGKKVILPVGDTHKENLKTELTQKGITVEIASLPKAASKEEKMTVIESNSKAKVSPKAKVEQAKKAATEAGVIETTENRSASTVEGGKPASWVERFARQGEHKPAAPVLASRKNSTQPLPGSGTDDSRRKAEPFTKKIQSNPTPRSHVTPVI